MSNFFFPKIDIKVLKDINNISNNENTINVLRKVVGENIHIYAIRWTIITLCMISISLLMVIPTPTIIDIILSVFYLIATTTCCSIMIGMWWIYLATRSG